MVKDIWRDMGVAVFVIVEGGIEGVDVFWSGVVVGG